MNAALWLILFRGGTFVVVPLTQPHAFVGGNVSYVVTSDSGTSSIVTSAAGTSSVVLTQTGDSYIG
jgi:hypothetical protein